MFGVDAYANQATGIFVPGDFTNWEGIKSDSGQVLSLGNAFLSKSGASKVMSAIGLSADMENRTGPEGWNGNYTKGWVYGPRSARESRDSGPWRYLDEQGRWVWLDGYVKLLGQNKSDIARWLFQNRYSPEVERGLMYVIPEQYGSLAELQRSINSLNASQAGTGGSVQVNLGMPSAAQGTGTGGNVAENQSSGTGTNQAGYSEGSTDTSKPTGNTQTGGPSGETAEKTSGNAPSGVSFFDKKIEIGGVEIPVVVLGGGAIALLLLLGGGDKK